MEEPNVSQDANEKASNPSAIPSAPTKTPADHPPAVDPSSFRGTVGEGMHRFSDTINNNLIAARYGVFAGVTLLTVYGLSQTPLFFRYRTVVDVPASSFIGRRRLYGRIIGVDTSSGTGSGDIQIHVRHLSPIGQILPKSWFDFLVRFSPQASRLGSSSKSGSSSIKPEENARDLLKVKIAGIHPPPVSRLTYKPEQFLERLARERTLVTCQLLARQVESTTVESPKETKRPISKVMPELAVGHSEQNVSSIQTYNQPLEVAICRVTYRPSLFQLFPTDIAESLIASGNASVSSSVLGRELPAPREGGSVKSVIKDSSQRLQDLRNDVKYLDRLAKAEFEAARQSMGMWSVPEVRASKHEVIEEVEFQTKAGVLQKLWRWVRGG